MEENEVEEKSFWSNFSQELMGAVAVCITLVCIVLLVSECTMRIAEENAKLTVECLKENTPAECAVFLDDDTLRR